MLGVGTITNPFLVETEQDLYDIRNNPDAIYRLTNDIYMTSYQTREGWLPIPNFHGVIEGDNYSIHDLYINRPNTSAGLIANLEDNTELGQANVGIFNLHLKDVNIVGGTNTGAIAGRVKGYPYVRVDYYGKNRSMVSPVLIEGCTVSGEIRSASDGIGGLVGRTISDVVPTDWDDNEMVNLEIEDSHVDADIYAFGREVGGLVGDATRGSVSIARSSSKGNIYNGFQNIGGLVGILTAGRGEIQNSYSLMNIQGSNYIGGIIGEIENGVVQSYRFNNNYFAGTFDAPNRSSTQIGAGVGFWGGVVNGDGGLKLMYDETKAQLNGAKFNTSSVKKRNVIALSTSQMKDVRVFLENGYDIFNTWYVNEGTKGDYLRLKNEFNEDLFFMAGNGTKEDPYQIKNVDNLISITRYDRQNWSEYNSILNDENTFTSPNYKPDMNFSNPNRYHYELTNDIDLDVYPWNIVGWYPLTKVNEIGNIGVTPSEFIRDTLWNRVWIEANNGYKTYDSIGNHTGFTDGVTTLGEGNRWALGVGGLHTKGFMGILNGNDFKIKNLYIKEWRGLKRLGLFDVISGGTVENIDLENVELDVDYNRGETLPSETINAGILANIIQTGSNINRVSVSGTSTIKDYRSDVGGAMFNVSGLIYEGRRYDRTAGSDLRRVIIRNSNVKINNTITNVDSSDVYKSHFTPFMNTVAYTRIENSYSATSHNAKNPQGIAISGTHGDRVFAKTITATGTILRSYYDSQVVNASSGANEATVVGKVEIYGRNTEAMKLQSTFVGWDFSIVWDTDGYNYPKFKPYDADYVPPSYTTEYMVLTSVDSLYMRVTSEGISKNVRKIVLKSHAKKGISKASTKKSGSTDVTTQIEELYAIAFAYENPVVEERQVLTSVEDIEMEATRELILVREHSVNTFIDEFNSSVDTERVIKGAFYNGFSIEAIKNNSIVIKINDKRIKAIDYNGSLIGVEGNFITLIMGQSDFVMGDNLVKISAKDENGEELLVKSLNINKKPSGKHKGERILVNGQYFDVIEDIDGELTLDRNLTQNIRRFNEENNYNIVELSQSKFTPEINGEELTFIGAKFDNGMIKDEFELVKDVETVTTKVDMSRTYKESGELTFDKNSDSTDLSSLKVLKSSSPSHPSSVSSFTSNVSKNLFGSVSVENDRETWIESIDYTGRINKMFTFDIISMIENQYKYNIPRDSRQEKAQWLRDNLSYPVDVRWLGGAIFREKDYSNLVGMRIWNYSQNSWSRDTFFETGQYISDEGLVSVTVSFGIEGSPIMSTSLRTDYISLNIKLNSPEDLSTLNEVEQVFIPKYNNSTTL